MQSKIARPVGKNSSVIVAVGRIFPYTLTMIGDPNCGFVVFVLVSVFIFPYSNPDPRPLSLGFAGDLMAVPSLQEQNLGELYDGAEPWLKRDQLNFINLETTVDPDRPLADYPAFNAHPAYVAAAIHAGFNVFNLANNHANDYGWSSVRATLGTLESLAKHHQIAFSGLRAEQSEPFRGAIIKKDGWRVGFLSFTNVVNQPEGQEGVAFFPYHNLWDTSDTLSFRKAVLARVKEFRPKVDWLVVGLHDGLEYDTQSFSWQKAFYRDLALAGADIVWVQHPHVLQPWWLVKTPRGTRLVLASMGNFVSGQTRELGPDDGDLPRADTGDSCLFRVRLVFKGGRLNIDRLQPVLFSQFYGVDGAERILPTQELAEHGPIVWREYFQARLDHQRQWARSGFIHDDRK